MPLWPIRLGCREAQTSLIELLEPRCPDHNRAKQPQSTRNWRLTWACTRALRPVKNGVFDRIADRQSKQRVSVKTALA